MYIRYLLLTALCSMLLFSCYEDTESTTVVTQQIEPGVSYRNDIVGVVIDTSGNVLPNVQVSIVGKITSTDNDGRFSFDNILIDEIGTHLAVANVGYVTTGIRLYPLKTLRQSVEITMVPENIGFLVNNSTGGVVTDPSGLTLTFSPESVRRGSAIYQGSYNINIFYIDSQDEVNFEKQLRAYDVSNQVSSSLPKINPLVMAYITVTDDSGVELTIDPDQPVSVVFPIPDAQNTSSPTIDLLSFDEESGLWMDEGTAVKESSNYKAELSHFSWWTVSNVVSTKTLCLNFESSLDTPPADNIFVINTLSGNHIYFGTVDYENDICIPVPANDDLVIKAYKYCVVEIGEWNINPMDITNDPLRFDIIENVDGYMINVAITDCNDLPLSGEYEVSHSNQVEVQDVNGTSFEIILNECFDRDKIGVIVKEKTSGSIYTVFLDIDPNMLTYETNVKICGDGLPEDEILIVGTEIFDNCRALLNPQEVIIFSDAPTELVAFDELKNGTQSCRIISRQYTGLGEVDISVIGVVGEHIIGKFKSDQDMNGDIIEGAFKALIQR